MFTISPNRLPSILKPSKYTSSQQANQESKDLISPPIIFAKQTSFNFNDNITSLGDLEACKPSNNVQESIQGCSASTLPGSTISFEGRSLSRASSLLANSGVLADDEPLKSPKTTTIQYVKVFEEIPEEQEAENFQYKQQITQEESYTSVEVPYKHITPVFECEGPSASFFSFSNKDKTVTHTNITRFSTLFGDEALPSSGRCKFSVKVEHCSAKNPKLYVGLVTKDQLNKPLSYKHGCYFVNTFSSESYLNGLKLLKSEVFAKLGQVISVLVDMDEKQISFHLDDVEILSGKLLIPGRDKNVELYPCISIGELGGSVSFI